MRKYYQLLLVIVCLISFVCLLVYRHQYNHLRYVLEVLNFFGKPGRVSDLSLCNYGINASVLSEKLEERRAYSLDVTPHFQRIDDNHFAYSSFWQSVDPHSTLDVRSQYHGVSNTIVLGSKHAKQNFKCYFVLEDDDKPIFGKFSYSRLESKAIVDNKKYVLFIFHCKLTRPMGLPYAVSFYPNSDQSPVYSPLLKMVDSDKKNAKTDTRPAPNRVSFEDRFKIIACVMPSVLPTVGKRDAVEFLSYHNLLGVSEFHVYDNSLPPNVLRRLQILPSELIGFTVRVLPFNFPYSSEDAYHVMRDLAELDCSLRSLNRNRRFEENDVRSNERISHVVNLSWDEFIVPRYHYLLKPFISKYEEGNRIKLQMATLHFCTNQRNDPKVKSDYPDVVKKTHYDKSISSDRPSYIYNIGSMSENDVSAMPAAAFGNGSLQKTEKVSQEIIAVHKYVDCKKSAADDMETRPHQFEGAMLRFAEDLFNARLYRLYRTEKIWSPIV